MTLAVAAGNSVPADASQICGSFHTTISVLPFDFWTAKLLPVIGRPSIEYFTDVGVNELALARISANMVVRL